MVQKLLKRVGLIYLLIGLLVTAVTHVLTGCTARPVAVTEISRSDITSAERALEWNRSRQLQSYLAVLEEERADPDAPLQTLAELHFRIGLLAKNNFHTNKASELFAQILEKDPDNALARAYLGASYALLARDYLLKGIFNVLPGPGFVRLYYVRRAIKLMDQAVAAEPRDPVVRLVRASTATGMPKVFGAFDEGMADFRTLMHWMEAPASNPDHAGMLTASAFQADVYYRLALVLRKEGRGEEAVPYWRRILSIAPQSPQAEVAKWMVN